MLTFYVELSFEYMVSFYRVFICPIFSDKFFFVIFGKREFRTVLLTLVAVYYIDNEPVTRVKSMHIKRESIVNVRSCYILEHPGIYSKGYNTRLQYTKVTYCLTNNIISKCLSVFEYLLIYIN